jgi:hypothetical protein
MHAKFGKVLCSGPTHVAISNFATRLDRITRSVAATCNNFKAADDATRVRQCLVVRGYHPKHEFHALRELLQTPSARNDAAPPKSKWQLHLSFTYWVLVLLGSPAVSRSLHDDDSPALHAIRDIVDTDEAMAPFRQVARGEIAWAEFEGILKDTSSLRRLFEGILEAADILAVTPASSANASQYADWKRRHARCVSFDEAACMGRPDMFEVWGNCLLPCLLGGDPYQLGPTVMTSMEKDGEGNFRHAFVGDGKMSAMAFLQATGLPTYRLNMQLRMAAGMFDLVCGIIYKGLDMKYAPSCDIDRPEFETGRLLEAYIQEKYPGEATPPPQGKLSPVFLDCPGSKVFLNQLTGSKSSRDQVIAALDFMIDFATAKGVDPAKFILIAPYADNVELASRLRETSKYACLASMAPASTVDGFQGKEGDIVFVVMGTAHPFPGPGFTSDAQRLNVCDI